jgi:hypothetical protein
MQKDNGIASEEVNQSNIRFYRAFALSPNSTYLA